MKKLNYELIVSDFDATLTNSQNEVPAAVVRAVNDYVANGGVFAVCTGRILPSILPRVKDMGLSGVVIAGQGCQIAEISTGRLLKNSVFSQDQASEICACLEELGVNIQLYSHDGFYSTLPQDEEHLNLYERITGIKSKRTDMPLSQFAKTAEHRFCKAAILVAPQERQALYEKVYARLGKKYDVTCSAKVLIEISPMGVTKGSALKFLAERFNIPMDKTVAVGDNLNDTSMVEAAGLGVAVANAEEELKRVADFIAPSCDDGGVALVIQKFGYKND